MALSNNPGEDRAWGLLAGLDPAVVCRKALVSYDADTRTYRVPSFGTGFTVSGKTKSISGTNQGSDALLEKLGQFFRLSLVWYLVSAKDIEETGRLVALGGVRGGEIFSKGSHVLPLGSLARTYGRNRNGFVDKGKSLGGQIVTLADSALRLLPLPRIPVVLALWLEDDEFPARTDLLFDSTCELQAATDILWTVAMLSVVAMLEDA